jgi:hypothetical protein
VALFGKRGRRLAALGAAGVGACAVLAACSPVQVGAAAVVGSQRITVSSLDTQVSNLQASVNHYDSTLQQINSGLQQQQQELPVFAVPPSQLVLNWQLSFAILDQMAAADGISVTPAQGDTALSKQAKTNSVSTNVYLTAIGIPVQQSQQAGRYLAEETALQAKYGSGGTAALTKAQCTAAKGLNIKVSPQFGRFDYSPSTMGLVAGNDTLSRPAGTPSPANTAGLTPAC